MNEFFFKKRLGVIKINESFIAVQNVEQNIKIETEYIPCRLTKPYQPRINISQKRYRNKISVSNNNKHTINS